VDASESIGNGDRLRLASDHAQGGETTRTARSGEVKIHIDAPPQKVWDTLADVERMGEWSPECRQVSWLDGAQSPAKVGARFKGSNKYDSLKWWHLLRPASAHGVPSRHWERTVRTSTA
jgi:hypothetical protein